MEWPVEKNVFRHRLGETIIIIDPPADDNDDLLEIAFVIIHL